MNKVSQKKKKNTPYKTYVWKVLAASIAIDNDVDFEIEFCTCDEDWAAVCEICHVFSRFIRKYSKTNDEILIEDVINYYRFEHPNKRVKLYSANARGLIESAMQGKNVDNEIKSHEERFWYIKEKDNSISCYKRHEGSSFNTRYIIAKGNNGIYTDLKTEYNRDGNFLYVREKDNSVSKYIHHANYRADKKS